MNWWHAHGAWVTILDTLLVVGVLLRLLSRRLPAGTTLAWAAIVGVVPFVGVLLYLMLGEVRIGRARLQRLKDVGPAFARWQGDLGERARRAVRPEDERGSTIAGLQRLGEAGTGFPAMGGNSLELLKDAEAFFRSFLQAIDGAKRAIHVQFYIWSDGGVVEEVVSALLRARERGVEVRILADGLGSKAWLRGQSPKRLRAAGVELIEIMPARLLRTIARRQDVRDHRKLALIDEDVAYAGSQNLADPALFKQSAGVGRWVDVMVKVRGPVVEALHGIFLRAYERETGRAIDLVTGDAERRLPATAGTAVVQPLPTGPAPDPGVIEEMVLASIYAAQRELVLTTPYFVPDAALTTSLRSAARRGVAVTLVVPAKVDSALTGWTARASYGPLMEAGVRIHEYEGGLLHSKTIAIDGKIAWIGSVNLDLRSLWINFELTLAVYDEEFTSEVRALQSEYLSRSRAVEPEAWECRGRWCRLRENAAQLLSPLL